MAARIDGIDSMQVAEFEIIPDGETARVVVSGAGRAPLVLDFDKAMVFRFAGRVLAVCDAIDHGQLVSSLRSVAERMGILPVGDAGGRTLAAGDGGSLAQSVAVLHDCASRAVDDLVRLGEAMLLISTRASAALACPEIAAPLGPPWRVELAAGPIEVDVDLDKGVVVVGVDDAKAQDLGLVAMSRSEAVILGGVLQAAGACVRPSVGAPVVVDASVTKTRGENER